MADNLGGILNDIYSSYTERQKTMVDYQENLMPKLNLSGEFDKYFKDSKDNIDVLKQAETERYRNLFKLHEQQDKLVKEAKIKESNQAIKIAEEMFSLNKGNLEKYTKLSQDLAKVYERIADNEKTTLGDLAEIYTLQRKQAELEKNTIEYKNAQFKKGVDTVKGAVSTAIKHIVDDFNKYWDLMYWDNLKKGITDLKSQYEENFTEIAARSGSDTKLDAHNIIKSTANTVVTDTILKSGLNFNNEVFPALTDAIRQGFMGQEAQEIAISNAIDKKIAPWLETSSETWVQLQYNLSDNTLAQIKGQQMLLQETRDGNRILQSGVVNQITDALVPTLQSIDANGTNKENMGAAYEYVEQLMAGGMTKSDAVSYVKKLIKADQDTFGALTSSDYSLVSMGIGAMNGGGIRGAQEFINSTWGRMLSSTADYDELGRGAISHVANLPLPSDDAYYKDIYNLEYTGKYDNKDTESIYNSTLGKLEEYVTATQLQDNSIQNAQAADMMDWNLMAHGLDVQEMILEEVINIKNWLVKILVTLPLTMAANKGIDGLIGLIKGGGTTNHNIGLLSNLFTGSKGVGGAINAGSMVGKSGAGLKYAGLLGGLTQGGTGLSGGMATGGIATGIGTAGLLGGVAMIGSGLAIGADTIKNWNDNSAIDNTVGSAASLGAIAGGGMLGAAALGLASGPVGWIGLAIGGISLLGKAAYDATTKIGGASEAIENEYNNQKESIKKSTEIQINNLTDIYGKLSESNLTESELKQQAQELIKTGLLTQKDEAVAREGNKDALIELTKAYLKSTQDFSIDIENDLDEVMVQSKNWSDEAWSSMEDMLQKWNDSEGGRSRNDSDFIEAANGIFSTLYSDLSKQMSDGKELDKSSQKIFDILEKTRDNGWDSSEINKIIDNGWLNEHLQSMSVSNPDVINRIQTKMYAFDTDASNEIADSMNSSYEYISSTEATNALQFLRPAANAVSAEDAIEYLEQFKEAGFKLSKFTNYSVYDDLKDKWDNEIDLNEYRLGSSYIPNDMIAQLHAGERVLTEGQNKKYTEELISGNSSSSIIQAGVQDIIIAIKTQTSDIINYLSSMSFNNTFTSATINMLPQMGNTKVTI